MWHLLQFYPRDKVDMGDRIIVNGKYKRNFIRSDTYLIFRNDFVSTRRSLF